MNKDDYVTKEYLDSKLKDFVTKDYLDKKFELMSIEFERHATDLASGINGKIKGVCDQLSAIDEKLTCLDQKVTVIDQKVTSLSLDVFNIKENMKEKVDKSEVLDLKKRVVKLEIKLA